MRSRGFADIKVLVVVLRAIIFQIPSNQVVMQFGQILIGLDQLSGRFLRVVEQV